MKSETLVAGHHWLRLCEASWANPLDATYSQRKGGRWNPPDSWPTLYLNEDILTARANLVLFTRGWPFEPEDLAEGAGPQVVVVELPADQEVADAHSPAGLESVDLPTTYPVHANGRPVTHQTCQKVGRQVKAADLAGVHARSAQLVAGRELAWFPGESDSATLVRRVDFATWYWQK